MIFAWNYQLSSFVENKGFTLFCRKMMKIAICALLRKVITRNSCREESYRFSLHWSKPLPGLSDMSQTVYLIFVTSISYMQVEKKSAMWRNFRFQYMKFLHMKRNFSFTTQQMWRNVKFCQIWRNFTFLHRTDVKKSEIYPVFLS